MLQLPTTIRLARLDEVPNQKGVRDSVMAGSSANIVEGYRFSYNQTDEILFGFFAEINVDNARLWALFKALVVQLPEEICLVFHLKDAEPSYSAYATKHTVLNELERYLLEVTQDGFLEVGVLYNDDSQLQEVFIRSAKYIQYWGSSEERFRQIMVEFDLFEIPDLNFIDQFPRVTEALRLFYPETTEPHEIIEQLGKIGQED